MTAQEFIKGCEHDGSYVPVKEVVRLMNEFSRAMCDKQKEICVKHAKVYIAGKLESTYCTINPDTILNAPYPDELQGNN